MNWNFNISSIHQAPLVTYSVDQSELWGKSLFLLAEDIRLFQHSQLWIDHEDRRKYCTRRFIKTRTPSKSIDLQNKPRWIFWQSISWTFICLSRRDYLLYWLYWWLFIDVVCCFILGFKLLYILLLGCFWPLEGWWWCAGHMRSSATSRCALLHVLDCRFKRANLLEAESCHPNRTCPAEATPPARPAQQQQVRNRARWWIPY